METEVGVLYFIDRRRNHKPRNAGEKGKENDCSLEPPAGIGTAKTLILASGYSFQTLTSRTLGELICFIQRH